MRKTAAVIAITVLGLFMAQGVSANILTFYGEITSVAQSNSLFKVGDNVYFDVHYNPTTNSVVRAMVTVHNSVLNLIRTNDGTTVFIDENPADGTVQWGVTNSGTFSVDVATNTPGGVIPCIDNFDLGRTFQLFLGGAYNAQGTVTARPKSRTGN